MINNTKVLIDEIYFPEGLRWHNNTLWFCDLWSKEVYSYSPNQKHLSREITLNDEPAGLGWLSNGTMLVTSLMNRKLLAYNNGVNVYADLSKYGPGFCHDFTVANDDSVYLSMSGFYPAYKADIKKSPIIRVSSDIKLSVAASELGYPNGIKIYNKKNNHKLIVSETFAARISQFDIKDNGTLTNRQYFCEFDKLGFSVEFNKDNIPKNQSRIYPDGLCYDPLKNQVWTASPGTGEVICLNMQGEIVNRIQTQSTPFDCIIGGCNNNQLFIASSDLSKSSRTGKIEHVLIN